MLNLSDTDDTLRERRNSKVLAEVVHCLVYVSVRGKHDSPIQAAMCSVLVAEEVATEVFGSSEILLKGVVTDDELLTFTQAMIRRLQIMEMI